MPAPPFDWDYLVLTAAHARQAASFDVELALRRDLGSLGTVRVARVIADFEDRRIGSGASTLECLREILRVEAQGRALSWDDAESILRRLRVLIVHAGGDARRLPAYSAAGKIFLPLPGPNDSALPLTMFDLLVRRFLELPSPLSGEGQVVVATGDALIDFDPAAVSFHAGITVLGSRASPQAAARHGVFCPGDNGALRLYLQKPTVEQQEAAHALDAGGHSVLDLGVMSMDAPAALALLRTFCELDPARPPQWSPAAKDAVLSHGLDLYREICAAFGTDATLEHYLATVASAGSRLAPSLLQPWFARLHPLPVRVEVLDPCRFLHFGTTRQLIDTGLALLSTGRQETSPAPHSLVLNSQVAAAIEPESARRWIENCRISAPLTLSGDNVLTGLDVAAPLSLAPGACLDVTPGSDRRARPCWFVRCYGLDDDFKRPLGAGATFCGVPFADWLARTGANPAEIWPADLPQSERTLWTARLFPEDASPEYGRWLWMFDLASATPADHAAFLSADRYSCAEIARLADSEAVRARRLDNHLANLQRDLPRLFSRASPFSARDLAFLLARHPNPAALAADLEALAREALAAAADPLAGFISARITHSLGSAIAALPRETQHTLTSAAQHDPGLAPASSLDLSAAWRARAFDTVTQVIVASSLCSAEPPRSSLRPDERVWGRAPARIELGGGWTDTPPYTLEYGGHVTNTAIDLSGQSPIHCYARVIGDRVIRMHSTDSGRHLEMSQLAELLDYRRPGDPFALAKAALAISGFSPSFAAWPENASLAAMLDHFGGGLELTTLVGIPQGSGLGTSSILGAVVLAVVQRVLGRPRAQQQLFHDVLRLEQALTTGGGWQDQIGGCTPGTKITETAPGLFPEPRVEPLPSDLLDPAVNGGATLLYYTGITRLAKDILQEIVGAYLDREPRIMAALAEEHRVARAIAGALSRQDLPGFGRYVDAAWELQKRLCGTVTNPEIESLLRRVRPHVHGMRISGAGSGGFLLMICKSPADALRVRDLLEREPLNPRSRFFDYSINHTGLQVTTC